LATNTTAPHFVYTNLTRQLAWRGLPRLGKRLDLDVHGPAGGPWLLGGAFGLVNVPVPPFGTLRLDPASLEVIASGALDPQGLGTLSVQLPVNPALVGLSVYLQALVGASPRLTNLETLTLTRF
jgi:hypothetical protein